MKLQCTLLAACAMLCLDAATAAPRGAILQPAAADIPALCARHLDEAKARIDKLKTMPLERVSAKSVLGAWNALDMGLQDLDGPLGLLAQVSPDAAVRKAAEECQLKLAALPNDYLQSEALYQRVKVIKTTDPIDAMARKLILEDFDQRGVNLPAPERQRAKEIFERLDKLAQDFNGNTRDVKTKLAFTDAELKGVPATALKERARDADGNYLFGLDYPDFEAIMVNAESEPVRQRYRAAYVQRGGQVNLDLLKEALGLRLELAKLMGAPSYADWALKRKMAGNPGAVNRFLADVQARVEALERRELDQLRVEKARLTGDPAAVIKAWDTAFYIERLKRARYSVDQNEVRAQFPTEPTIAWMMNITSKLYGVKFVANKELPVWHEDVRAYDVFEGSSGKYLSSFYLDLFPREGKYKHAAAFGARSGSLAAGRTPVSALVTNFSRIGFDQQELETLFHEFGHIMHGVLSKTRYLLDAGTSTKWDFVEAPSQMYEAWSRRPETLALFGATCASCKPIDMGLIARMNEARKFGVGRQYARQRLLAAYDMSLHTATLVDPLQAYVDIATNTPLGYEPGDWLPASFGHMMGGYQAGYYGYMWSEVMAMDMRSAFGTNFMDPKVGARYRKIILESGGERAPGELVAQFLGRKPSPDAFFREITGQDGPKR